MALCLSPNCGVDIVLALCLASSERLYLVREELYTFKLYLPKILSGGSLCGKSCVDAIVKILLGEGRDVELSARTSKHILVFAFDPLSLTLSLSYCVLHHIVHIIYMLGLIVCPYLCLTKRASYSTSSLI